MAEREGNGGRQWGKAMGEGRGEVHAMLCLDRTKGRPKNSAVKISATNQQEIVWAMAMALSKLKTPTGSLRPFFSPFRSIIPPFFAFPHRLTTFYRTNSNSNLNK